MLNSLRLLWNQLSTADALIRHLDIVENAIEKHRKASTQAKPTDHFKTFCICLFVIFVQSA